MGTGTGPRKGRYSGGRRHGHGKSGPMKGAVPRHERLRSRDFTGIGFALITASAYACIDVTAKLAYRSGVSVATLLSARFFGAGLMLLLLTRAMAVGPMPSGATVVRVLLLGASGFAMASFLLNLSLHRMAVGPVILIFYTYPALTAVMAIVLRGERMTKLRLVALALSLVGVSILLSFPTEGMNAPGVLFALGAALAFAFYNIVAERSARTAHNLIFSGLILVGAGVTISALGLLSGGIDLGLRPSSWGWVLLHILLISTATVSLTGAITRVGATRAAIGNTAEPALAVILAAIVLGERLGPFQLVGGIILIITISLLPFAGNGDGSTRPQLST
jgi:drug/metabolite transporter (DMT)-like permease